MGIGLQTDQSRSSSVPTIYRMRGCPCRSSQNSVPFVTQQVFQPAIDFSFFRSTRSGLVKLCLYILELLISGPWSLLPFLQASKCNTAASKALANNLFQCELPFSTFACQESALRSRWINTRTFSSAITHLVLGNHSLPLRFKQLPSSISPTLPRPSMIGEVDHAITNWKCRLSLLMRRDCCMYRTGPILRLPA